MVDRVALQRWLASQEVADALAFQPQRWTVDTVAEPLLADAVALPQRRKEAALDVEEVRLNVVGELALLRLPTC